MLILLVAAGGAVGAVARYGLSGWVQGLLGTSFPMGTLVVNVVGSFLLGLSFFLLESLALPAGARSMITIGFLGAFTTFSTFSYEAIILLGGGEWGRGGLYVFGSLILGLLGVVAGLSLGSFLLQARG